MTLERKHFCALLDHPKTQERIMGMLQTGKPGAQLKRSARTHEHEQASSRRLHRRRHAHADRQVAAAGYFRNTRPDDLLVAAIRSALTQVPTLDPKAIEDAIIGCSFPEAEQGMNMARIAVLLAGLPNTGRRRHRQPLLRLGPDRGADGGRPHPRRRGRRDDRRRRRVDEHGADERQQAVVQPGRSSRSDENVGIAYGMGLTAEKVAAQWKVSREAQDAFALRVAPAGADGAAGRRVHRRDDADRGGRALPEPGHRRDRRRRRAPSSLDEGPRADTSLEGLAKLRPVFAAKGSVTAGNSSQTQRRRRRADPRPARRRSSSST